MKQWPCIVSQLQYSVSASTNSLEHTGGKQDFARDRNLNSETFNNFSSTYQEKEL